MCGIGGFQLVEGDGDSRRLAQGLLRGLIVRGRDASGIAYHADDERQTWIIKSNISGDRLAKDLPDEVGRCAIVHTRWATQGSPKRNINNHPIDVRGIVGVHNGHIVNDDALIKACGDYQRQGEVDSEAAFAYIMHGPKDRTLMQRLGDIRGGAALLWLNTRGKMRYLHAARISSSPLVVATTERGSVIMASTWEAIEAGVRVGGQVVVGKESLAEGQYVRFQNGDINLLGDIDLPQQSLFHLPAPNHAASFSHPSFTRGGLNDHGRYETAVERMLRELEADMNRQYDADNR